MRCETRGARWLNDGVDVEIRRNEEGNLLVTRPISTEKSARGRLTLEGGSVNVESPLHLGDGDLTVRGSELSQYAPIRSERGAIIVETAKATLQQMHAPELRIFTPMTDRIDDCQCADRPVRRAAPTLTLSPPA